MDRGLSYPLSSQMFLEVGIAFKATEKINLTTFWHWKTGGIRGIKGIKESENIRFTQNLRISSFLLKKRYFTCRSLLFVRCSLLFGSCSTLFSRRWSLLFTRYLFFSVCCSLLFARWLLLSACCSLLLARCLLCFACWSLIFVLYS